MDPQNIDSSQIGSQRELEFAQLWVSYYPGIDLVTQHRYNPKRKFTLDFAHLPSKTAVEVNGAIWSKGGHNTGRGLLRDYRKALDAATLGWLVLPIAPDDFSPETLAKIAAVIQLRSR